MLIEIHMIQNHSPSNLNRDDLGAPKSCVFGGATRARISSQCLKRSIRRPANPDDVHKRTPGLLASAMGAFVGTKTKYLPWLVGEEIKNRQPSFKDTERIQIVQAVKSIARKDANPGKSAGSRDFDDRPKTPQLIHLGPGYAKRFVERLADLKTRMPSEYAYYLNPVVGFQECLRGVLADSGLKEADCNRAVRAAPFLATSRRAMLFPVADDEPRQDYALDWGLGGLGVEHAKLIAERLQALDRSDVPDDIASLKAALAAPSKDENQALGQTVPEKPAGMKKFLDELSSLDRHDAIDVALFGRMTTSDSFEDVEASVQVAHAISTHEAITEVDYFTAVDDLGKSGGGAGHVDEAMFNSACFYKYFSLDWDQLLDNLTPPSSGRAAADEHNDMMQYRRGLAAAAVGHFLRAAALSSPSGKQNSFAAHNPPDAILVEIKNEKIPISYANAFAQPVNPKSPNGLIGQSIACLATYASEVGASYGIDSKRFWFRPGGRSIAPNEMTDRFSAGTLPDPPLASLDLLVSMVVESATGLEWDQVRGLGAAARPEA